MIKSLEVSSPDSCLNRAADDEMLFVLRGKDPCFAAAVLYWAKLRVDSGVDKFDSPKITGAVADAEVFGKHMAVLGDAFRKKSEAPAGPTC